MKKTPMRKIDLDLENSIFSHDHRVCMVRQAHHERELFIPYIVTLLEGRVRSLP